MSIRANKKEDIKDILEALEKRIDQCRMLYELYFSGIEKREPLWHRQEIVRVFTQLRRETINNAIDRFRLQGLQARFNSFTQYWNRINLQREQGTYSKDLRKAQRRIGAEAASNAAKTPDADLPPGDTAEEVPKVYSLSDLDKPDLGDSERRASLAAAAAAAATERSTRGDGGSLSDDRIQTIYRTYVAAKQKCGESTDGLSYDLISRSIRQQVPKLQERGYDRIDFKVVIRDGKAAIKPVGKKSSES